MSRLTHIDESGAARMVNVGAKPRTNRRAVARGRITMSAEAFTLMLEGTAQKGDVLAVARVAGIMAAKRTSELIPLCHNVPLASIVVDLEPVPAERAVLISAEVENIDRTGVEMEALTAVSVAALTIYDMLKAVDRAMVIGEIRVTEKSGGAHVIAEAAPVPTLRAPTSVPSPAPVAVPAVAAVAPAASPGPGAAAPSFAPPVLAAPPSISVVPKGATVPGLMPPPELMRALAEGATSSRGEGRPLTPPIAPEAPPLPSLRAPETAAPRLGTPSIIDLAVASSRAREVRELNRDDELATLRDYLFHDRIANAYLLGDLDAPYAEHGRWFGLPLAAPVSGAARTPEAEAGLDGVVLLYNGLSMPAVLAAGTPASVAALMTGARAHLPRRFYAHIHAAHREAVELHYAPRAWSEMSRMGLVRADWVDPGEDTTSVEALSHRDTAAIMHLYRHYPDNFFDPAQLGTGLYFGVRENGELLSVAGVHVVSPVFDVAVIGNIVTHTEHRGRRLASRCVGALLRALFEQVGHVALNVQVTNAPAIACYARFGFREHGRCLEGWVQAR